MSDIRQKVRIPGPVSASPMPSQEGWAVWSGPGGTVESHPVMRVDDLHRFSTFGKEREGDA